MKTQKTKLVFGKNSITELNDKEVTKVYGGSGYICSNCTPDPLSDKIRDAASIANGGQN